MHPERRESLSLDLWGKYDAAHAELVKGCWAFREGRGSDSDMDCELITGGF
jgi:hypothetical protein